MLIFTFSQPFFVKLLIKDKIYVSISHILRDLNYNYKTLC